MNFWQERQFVSYSIWFSVFMDKFHLGKFSWDEVTISEDCRCNPCWMDLILHRRNDIHAIWRWSWCSPGVQQNSNPSCKCYNASVDKPSSTESSLKFFAAMNLPLLSRITTPVVPVKLSSSKEASTLILTTYTHCAKVIFYLCIHFLVKQRLEYHKKHVNSRLDHP